MVARWHLARATSRLDINSEDIENTPLGSCVFSRKKLSYTMNFNSTPFLQCVLGYPPISLRTGSKRSEVGKKKSASESERRDSASEASACARLHSAISP